MLRRNMKLALKTRIQQMHLVLLALMTDQNTVPTLIMKGTSPM